jgi:hypothetical protein
MTFRVCAMRVAVSGLILGLAGCDTMLDHPDESYTPATSAAVLWPRPDDNVAAPPASSDAQPASHRIAPTTSGGSTADNSVN